MRFKLIFKFICALFCFRIRKTKRWEDIFYLLFILFKKELLQPQYRRCNLQLLKENFKLWKRRVLNYLHLTMTEHLIGFQAPRELRDQLSLRSQPYTRYLNKEKKHKQILGQFQTKYENEQIVKIFDFFFSFSLLRFLIFL